MYSNRQPNSLGESHKTLDFEEKLANQPVLPATTAPTVSDDSSSPAERKRAVIEAALARARAQRDTT